MRKYLLSLLLILLLLGIYLSVKPTEPEISFDAYPEHEGKSISYVLIDGLDKGHFSNLRAKGKLPQMDKLIKNGLYIENGIGSFPSMTGYAFYPFLTGIDAVNSGILGLRWFDKNRKSGQFRNYVGRTNIHMNEDLDPKYETLFQIYDKNYTGSVNSYMTKGVKDEIKTGWALTTSKYQDLLLFKFLRWLPGIGLRITYSHYQHETQVNNEAINQLQYNPPVQWITFAAPDAYAHINGLDEEYDNIVMHIDSLIGSLIAHSKKLGQERYFAVITDHGLETVVRNIHVIEETSKDIPLKLKRGDSTNLLFSDMDDNAEEEIIDGYFVINGNLLSYIYLLPEEETQNKEKLTADDLSNYIAISGDTLDLVDYYAKQDYIEMIMVKEQDSIVSIYTNQGHALLSKKNNKYKYQPITDDVFNYKNDSLSQSLIGDYYTLDNWLSQTRNSDFPFAVVRAFDLAIHPSSGDIILCSGENIDLAKDYEILVGNYKGGHGGLRSSMLSVPYIISGPDLDQQFIPDARAEDIGATIIKLLNVNTSYPLDGKNLLE